MAMTKKHYQAFADLMHDVRGLEIPKEWGGDFAATYLIGYIEERMAYLFEYDNERFDRQRFEKWCEEGTDR